jgi:hypothetical protein
MSGVDRETRVIGRSSLMMADRPDEQIELLGVLGPHRVRRARGHLPACAARQQHHDDKQKDRNSTFHGCVLLSNDNVECVYRHESPRWWAVAGESTPAGRERRPPDCVRRACTCRAACRLDTRGAGVSVSSGLRSAS